VTTDSQEAAARDSGDLRRGVAIQYLGYLLKIAVPVLTILVVRAYGKASFGLFVAAQAALMWLMRLALVGMDKGLIWWVARQPAGAEARGVFSVATWVAALATVAALGLVASAPFVADLIGAPAAEGLLRWMAPGLVPLALAEVFVAASHGRRRVEVQVIVKDFLLGAVLAGSALVFAWSGQAKLGLAWAFLAATTAAFVVALAAWWRIVRPTRLAVGRPPRELMRYAAPMWGSEMLNALIQRLDLFVVAHAADPATLGIYAVVVQVANTIRSIRQAFDAIVTAILSEVARTRDTLRLRHNFSYATMLVVATQMPIYAALIAFVPYLLQLYGPGFDAGATAVLILCAFWMLNGVLGLNGLLVISHGHSRFMLYNTAGTLLLLAWLLVSWVPGAPLEGAAWAVAITYSATNLLWLVQSIVTLKAWPYTGAVLPPLVYGTAAAVAMGLVWLALAGTAEVAARTLGFTAFLLVYGAGMAREWRAGRLSGHLGAPA
jgi:O-antigen/teichoic acid export membrane protein